MITIIKPKLNGSRVKRGNIHNKLNNAYSYVGNGILQKNILFAGSYFLLKWSNVFRRYYTCKITWIVATGCLYWQVCALLFQLNAIQSPGDLDQFKVDHGDWMADQGIPCWRMKMDDKADVCRVLLKQAIFYRYLQIGGNLDIITNGYEGQSINSTPRINPSYIWPILYQYIHNVARPIQLSFNACRWLNHQFNVFIVKLVNIVSHNQSLRLKRVNAHM